MAEQLSGYDFINRWNGLVDHNMVSVYAGATERGGKDDPDLKRPAHAGVTVFLWDAKYSGPRWYPAPSRFPQQLRIRSAEGTVLRMTSPRGDEFFFDVAQLEYLG